MRQWVAAVLAAWGAFVGTGLGAEVCSEQSYEGNRYALCRVDIASADLRLFLRDDEGRVFGNFAPVNDALAADGKELVFAMNAGMYHEDRSPVGLYVEDGTQVQHLITSEGPGNFGLLPNGVLCLTPGAARVVESRRFARDRLAREGESCAFATQSGPMLVIDGALHPRFIDGGTSRHIRNGVGISADGRTAYFVISRNVVNFHDFGSYFKDELKTPNALYFDGKVSRLYAPELGSSGVGWPMGPIVGLVEDRLE